MTHQEKEKTMTTITRADLPADPTTAYRELTDMIAGHQRAEQDLLGLRDRVLREIAGEGRGAVARVARATGVSHPRAGRMLVDGLLRAVHRAAEAAGLERGEYAVRELGQSYPPRVAVSLVDDTVYPSDNEEWDECNPHDQDRQRDAERAAWVGLMNAAGALLTELRRAGLMYEADGLGTDVNNRGPRNALARGDEITVEWAD